MSSIAGIFSFTKDICQYKDKLQQMCSLIKNDNTQEHYEYYPNAYIGQRNLLDTNCEKEFLLKYTYNNQNYGIVFNGNLYNKEKLKKELIIKGYHFTTTSEAEVILMYYIVYQNRCVNYFDGAFSFIIYTPNTIFGCRDHLGVKPLFYSLENDILTVGSEIKSLLCFKEKAIVNKNGLLELLGLGPSVSPGKTIYKNISSLRPGHYFTFTHSKFEVSCYFKLTPLKYNDNYITATNKVRDLLVNSISQQIPLNNSISTMLSGGVDSSIITAITSNFIPKLSTYSINYEDQQKYFKSYDYQTSQDDDFINLVVEKYNTNHHYITVNQKSLIDKLKISLIARDMPGMADIDSSFYCFEKTIAEDFNIVLSGECADEIFGGYPWFYKEELYSKHFFPWLLDLDQRIELLNESIKNLPIKEYVLNAYDATLNEVKYLDNESSEDKRKRKMIYLCKEWFMQTLLTRGESQSIYASIDCRMPFASKDLIEYVFNLPWNYLYHNNQEKAILRDAFKNELPDEILNRKKNPYPKTYSPVYTDLICELLNDSLSDHNNIILQLFDLGKIKQLIETKGSSFKYPWFGQLMMGPQLIAYLYQIYLWGNLYHIELEL